MPTTMSDLKMKPAQVLAVRAKGPTKGELTLYGNIGASFWEEGITAKSVADALKAMDPAVNELTVRINSGGGDVFDGVAIYNRIKQFKGKKTVIVDGLAASIASIIMLAGDEIILSEGVLVMIHLPWTMAMGNRTDIENTVDRLRDVEEQMLTMYSKKTGQDRNILRGMLEKETWMDADQAIELGFATSKSEDESLPIAASVMKSPWMAKAPRNYKSETALVTGNIKDLKSKIGVTLARKK